MLFLAISQNFTKIERVVFEYARKYANNCGVEKTGDIPHRGGGTQTRSLTVQKNEKITRTIPILNKILHNFHLNNIFIRWILKVLHIWGDKGGGHGALSVQKNEKITRTVPILKSNFQ